MHAIVEWLAPYAGVLLTAAWRGALVLVLALVLATALRDRPAAARHMVWTLAIAAQLALPAFAYWGPRWPVRLPHAVALLLPATMVPERSSHVSDTLGNASAVAQRTQSVAPNVTPVQGERPSPAAADPADPDTITRNAAVRDAAPVSGVELLAWIWLAGALLVLGRLAAGTIVVAKLARRGTRVHDGAWLSLVQQLSASLAIARPLTLLSGSRLGVPVTWGILYPVVMLPDDADTWSEERRRFVLVHELAHIKRLDALTQLLGQIALMLFWFNPLVWIANRRMQLEREHACDDYVLRHGTSPSHYAEELLAMVRALGTPSHRSAQPAFATLAMARRSEFEGRMLSILDPRLERYAIGKGRALMGAIAALVIILPLAALQPYNATTPRTTDSPAPAVAATGDSMNDTHRTAAGAVTPQGATPHAAPSGTAAAGGVFDTVTTQRTPGLWPTRTWPNTLRVTDPVPVSAIDPWATTPSVPGSTGDTVAEDRKTAEACAGNWNERGQRISTHTHSDDDGDSAPSITYVQMTAARCLSAVVHGRVVWSANEDDIVRMPPGAVAMFRERTPGTDRTLMVSGEAGGSIRWVYGVNGREQPYDADARHWLRTFLPDFLAEAGVNVASRVARWRSEGGVDNVLARIATLRSTGSKRAHYEALLQGGELRESELDDIVRQAGSELRSSSGDLRSVLTAVASQTGRRGGEMHASRALESAIAGIGSSGDRTQVLTQYGTTGDRDMLLLVARLARGIESSGDEARLLMTLAARYHTDDDRALVDAFYAAVRAISSDGDKRNVLTSAVPFAAPYTPATLALLATSRAISSSGDRAAVMMALVGTGVLRDSTVRHAFVDAAAGISSDGDRSRVLLAAARN